MSRNVAIFLVCVVLLVVLVLTVVAFRLESSWSTFWPDLIVGVIGAGGVGAVLVIVQNRLEARRSDELLDASRQAAALARLQYEGTVGHASRIAREEWAASMRTWWASVADAGGRPSAEQDLTESGLDLTSRHLYAHDDTQALWARFAHLRSDLMSAMEGVDPEMAKVFYRRRGYELIDGWLRDRPGRL